MDIREAAGGYVFLWTKGSGGLVQPQANEAESLCRHIGGIITQAGARKIGAELWSTRIYYTIYAP